MFVDPVYRQSPEYRLFWEKLERGEYRRSAIQAHRQGRQGSLDSGELQPDHGCERQAVQGREIRLRHHRHAHGGRADQGSGRGGQEPGSDPSHSDGGQDRRTRNAVRRRERTARQHLRGHERDQGVGARSDERLGRNLHRHHRSVAAHRGAGREPGRDLGLDGRDFRDREEERRERPAGQPVGRAAPARSRIAAARWSPGGRRRWRRSRNPRARSPTSSA